MLAWYAASITFYDAVRDRNQGIKAANMIGDILSRRTDAATPIYLDSLETLFADLAGDRGVTGLRVSQIQWDGTKHIIDWSYSTETVAFPKLTEAEMTMTWFTDQVPTMFSGEFVLIVESFSAYTPLFNVGLKKEGNLYKNFIVTSPRFAARLAWDDPNDPDPGGNGDGEEGGATAGG
ncbi:hypothetical protein [Litoreibacter roseus]|nr:hypothetical protein [Litoreibacter roseus]